MVPNSTNDIPAEPGFDEDYNDYQKHIQDALDASGEQGNIVLSTKIPIDTFTDPQGVQITRIAWLLHEKEHKMFYVKTVKQETEFAAQTHDKDVFTYIQEGHLKIESDDNSYPSLQNEWFLIKKNTLYSVTTTDKEYRVLEAYQPESDDEEDYKQYKKHIQDALDASGVEGNPIVLSTDIPIKSETDSQGVPITPIAWLLYRKKHKMFYVKKVEEGTEFEKHTHDEDVFRYILEGDLTIKTYGYAYPLKEGDWFLIKKNTPYSVTTDNGYTVLAAYQFRCAGLTR